jgi:hypothetical protein
VKTDVETRELKNGDENRELKVSSNLQLTTGNNEMSVKESSFHQGVAVPMSLEDYEKELAREKDLLNKAKKKIAMESSTQKDGISTWILLSGSNNPTTSRPDMKPAFRIDSAEKKPVNKNNSTMTTKKRTTVTPTTKVTKPTQKYNNNKLITRVKISSSELVKNETEVEVTTKAAPTTKKVQLTTKAKKYTTLRPKTTTTTAASTTEAAIEIIDDDQTPPPAVETSTFLILEAKEADFNLPSDRAPSNSKPAKKTKTGTTTKTKKKKIVGASTNSTTKIKKKSDKKTTDLKLQSKKPEKPITTQIYNYLAREVMPTVGVGLVGLVVTAGLATYFLGGPLGALRRSYDIASRRDDVVYDRSDEFGNVQNEEEMFGKVIAGMPENSAYRNNIRVSSYRPKVQQYSGYSQYAQQSPQQPSKYGATQHLRYRTIDPYQNSYQNQNSVAAQPQAQQQQYPQYYQQQAQAKSSIEYPQQQQVQAQQQNVQTAAKFNIDEINLTTNQPDSPIYSMDYDEVAQSYFPQQEQTQTGQISVEQQKLQEIEQQQPQSESQRSEKITIVQAQSVPSNHRIEEQQQQQQHSELPTPAALTSMSHSDEEYQNSIANAIMNQKKQFVVGSVIAEHFEDNPPSIVPEHGPRRRRREAIKAAKSLEDNEIEDDDKTKRETETMTMKAEETSTASAKEETESSSSASENFETQTHEETTTNYPTYNIDDRQNNIFDLFRRVIDLKLRLGLNFLQNATLAFQQYLKGVEARVNSSPLFNPYNQTNSNETSRKSEKILRKKVQSL